MLELHEFPRHKTMVVMEGRRVKAKAKYFANAKTWILTAYGFQWLDDAANRPNVFGTVHRGLMLAKTKAETRRHLQDLIKLGHR